MCQLMGISSRNSTTSSPYLSLFQERGERNPHGWGLAYYLNGSAIVVKEPIKATSSRRYDLLIEDNKVVSKIFIGHVRAKYVGEVAERNTHPFKLKLFNTDYVFAHNGGFKNFSHYSTGQFKPMGETGSEHIFCHVLHEIEENRLDRWRKDDYEALEGLFGEINRLGSLNILMSDGERLFCFHDKDGHNNVRDGKPVGLFTIKPVAGKYVIATRPLPLGAGGWSDLPCGKLFVLRDGEICYG